VPAEPLLSSAFFTVKFLTSDEGKAVADDFDTTNEVTGSLSSLLRFQIRRLADAPTRQRRQGEGLG